MPTLGVPRHHRAISRVVFYLGVGLVLTIMGRLTEPPPLDVPREWTDEELGVARVYIASPVWPEGAIPRGR